MLLAHFSVAVSTPTPIRKDLLPYARDVSGALAEDSRIRQIASIFLRLVGRINGRADDALLTRQGQAMRNQDHLLKIKRLQRVDSLWPVASRPLDGAVAFAPVCIRIGDVFIGAVGAVALLARRRSAGVRVH